MPLLQSCPGIDDLVDHDEAGFVDLLEHVAEDALDGRNAAHLVERVLEDRLGRIVLPQSGQIGRALGQDGLGREVLHPSVGHRAEPAAVATAARKLHHAQH
mgnify:CR=1 FL=1